MPHNNDIQRILIEFDCITQKQLRAALTHQEGKEPEKSLEEILVELGFIGESDLLTHLSEAFRVHYITSHKLSTVSIPQGVINLIPVEFAEEHTVLPLFCYDKAKILAVVMADCRNKQLLAQIKTTSGYTALEPYLALGSATKAAIAKHYRNEQSAFDQLKSLFKARPLRTLAGGAPQDTSGILDSNRRSPSAFGEQGPRRQADHIASHSLMSENTFIEVLNIVISTLEKHKDHTASVAKLAKEVSVTLGSSPRETYCTVLAAYLHDCCMNSPKHLALLLFDSKDDGPLLRKYAQSAQRLFEKAHLPEEVYTALSHTFERYDGNGLPDGLKGKEIPQGSRIIAVVDAYMHLLTFEKNGSSDNPYRESLATIKPLANTYFDPEVVDTLEEVIIDRLVDENSPRVLIISSAFQEVEPLVKQLKKGGINPYVASNTDEAKYILQRSAIALIVSALNTHPLDGLSFYHSIKPEDEFKEIPFLLGSENGDQATVQKALEEGVADVLQLPYKNEELIAKVRKYIQQSSLKTNSEAAASIDRKGLSGNLDEIQLVDLIQMFLRGRKTGVVKLSREKEQGELFFDKGQVTEARYKGLNGVEAFNLLVRWQNGFFVFYPEIALPEPKIAVGTDKLLMEAYWIWDEEKVTTSELRP